MRRLLDRDLLTALVLLAVGTVFSVGSSADAKDWIFPRLANYLVLGIAAFMLARVIFSAIMKRTPDTLQLTAEDRTAFIDVLVFLVVVLAYMFVMFGLGFWLSSLFMLALTSIYLTLEKTRRNVRMALIVPLCVCIAAYLIFTHVFYVPFPAGTWLPGSG